MVKEYNPRTNTWRNVQSLQQKRCGHSVCTLDSKIFVLGGGAVVVERKIYVMGSVTTDVDVYDVNQDQWNNVTNIPSSRLNPDVSALGNKINVTGGWNGSQTVQFRLL